MKAKWLRYRLCIVSFFGSLLLTVAFASPTLAHWADLAVAEIMVDKTQTQVTLTFPTGLVASADDNQDGQLSPDEVRKHQGELEKFLGDRIRLIDVKEGKGNLSIASLDTPQGTTANITPNTHSTLQLLYSWQQPVQGLKMHYDLFLPSAPAAHCMATILNQGQVQNFMFTRQNRELWLAGGGLQFGTNWGGNWLVAVAGAFLWGAMHAMSPGHGKTIVGAYLVGSRATPQHAIFLGLTTTLTHTIGVFALGLITLFASQYILPDQLLPWLSIVSGVMVVAIGLNLFFSRLRGHHHHHHDHDHDHHHHDHHHHDYDHHHHHLTPDDAPITWKTLLALGISGGLVPCPSALVLLLSAVAFGRAGLGLALVLAFSLGLAGVLIGLGLLLVYAKRRFEKLPQRPMRLMRLLPAVSALCISLLGVGITARALMDMANS